jgi:hypothetical protein
MPTTHQSCCAVHPTGASRTDAGAHATGAVAHLDLVGSPDSIQPDSLMMYLNGVLPPDVKVQQLQLAPPGEALLASTHTCTCGKQAPLFLMQCYSLTFTIDVLQDLQPACHHKSPLHTQKRTCMPG